MRLTLRTLLSYLDDTLEPSQAKLIGAKVAESEQARELIERIKQVTRRRRLTTPPPSGPGGIDPNTIAEYLDNEVTPEKAAEVEQICLASDVHLAEVAACHQILTLVLGEPALVPSSSKQRMYALVKGPESIHARKPKGPSKHELDLSSEIEPDQDETLRLGVPAFGKGDSRNMWVLIGGGALAACLLIVAIAQLFRSPPPNVNEPKIDLAATDSKDNPKTAPAKPVEGSKTPDDKKTPQEATPPKEKPIEPKKVDFPANIVVEPVPFEGPVGTVPVAEIPYQPASLKQAPVGKFVANPKEPGVLLQLKADKTGWMRVLKIQNDTVYSGRPVMSLAGSKLAVALDTGIELTLWGNLPEVTFDPINLESRAIVHANDVLSADLTVQRGRLLIKSNVTGGREARVRVRFDNPTDGKEEHLDITLQGPGSVVAIERHCELDWNEPFYPNPKDKARNGPTAMVKIYAYIGGARVRFGQDSYSIDEKQQPLLTWQSREAVLSPPKETNLPFWFKSKGSPMVPDNKKEMETRELAIAAHNTLTKLLETKQVSVALDEMIQTIEKDAQREMVTSKEKLPAFATFVAWRHALHAKLALDDITYVFGVLSEEGTIPIFRGLCPQMLHDWVGLERDHDYQFLEMLRKRPFSYNGITSVKIMELLHWIPQKELQTPAKYQQLIEGLNNELLPIRLLSYWHLFLRVEAGRRIPYDATAPQSARAKAVQQWFELIPPGRLPPAAAAPMKK